MWHEELQHRVLSKICDTCGRAFARNEHLIRHRRIHTRERPFRCPDCNIGFPRSDVREKHMRKFHPKEGQEPEALTLSCAERAKPRKIERSKLACDECRKRKLKCNNVLPCQSCRTKLLPCTVSSTSRPPGRPRNAVPASPDCQAADSNGPSEPDVPPNPGPWAPSGMDLSLVGPSLASNPSGSQMPCMMGHVGTCTSAVEQPQPALEHGMAAVAIPHDPLEAAFQGSSLWEEIDMMDELLPQPSLENWLDDMDAFSSLDDVWPSKSAASEMDWNSPMENAVGMMKSHLHRRSRASSPSCDEQTRSWYSATPQLHIYDRDVLNILLNLARSHISSTFAVFSDFSAGAGTRLELCLAMAAIGGLYCTIQAGIKIAKKLFNDARRLFNEAYLRDSICSFEMSLSFAKTFILLEIYGLCSGDKRAYEFIEVFHASKQHTLHVCQAALTSQASSEERRQVSLLTEAMRVLDSYRVLLLQRPPSFAPDCQVQARTSNDQSISQGVPGGGAASVLSPGSPIDLESADMNQLVSIISYSWMASPHCLEGSAYSPLWKPEFVELALNRWIKARSAGLDLSRPSDLSQMLLFHLSHVALHSSLRSLQRLTQKAIRSAMSSQSAEAVDSLRAWKNSTHFDIALWHAKAILRIVQEAPVTSRQRRQSHKARPRSIEAPHLPLCIYFATLVIWYGELLSDSETGSADIAIEDGSQLLFKLKVHVSKQLGAALCELLSNESEEDEA